MSSLGVLAWVQGPVVHCVAANPIVVSIQAGIHQRRRGRGEGERDRERIEGETERERVRKREEKERGGLLWRDGETDGDFDQLKDFSGIRAARSPSNRFLLKVQQTENKGPPSGPTQTRDLI